ncbi:MAG: 50S ribosomal protein L21 [Candidatus Brocadiia bacterium]
MYAVIESGGKQHKVAPGDTIEVERLPDKAGEPIEFERVLFYSDGDDVRWGSPTLADVRVIGSVVAHELGEKITVATFKRRKGRRRKMGHRQKLTRVQINRILAS